MTAIEESEEDASRGFAQVLGVRRAYRRQGIGEALVRHTFRSLYERGKAGCDLHVDAESETGATRIYERLGMTAHPRFATWEKELRPGSETPPAIRRAEPRSALLRRKGGSLAQQSCRIAVWDASPSRPVGYSHESLSGLLAA